MLLVWLLIMWSQLFEGCNANQIRHTMSFLCKQAFRTLSHILSFHQNRGFLTKDTKMPVMAVFLRLPACLPSFILSTKLYSKEKSFSIIAEGDTVASPPHRAAQRAKFAKKVHKPPLRVNVINFELNGFNASIWVPWSPSDPKKLWCTDRSIQIHKICVKISCMFAPILL